MASPVSIYVMESNAPISPPCKNGFALCKIGISQNPTNRLASIRTASPFGIDLSGTWRLSCRQEAELIERRFHEDHKECRSSREWFLGYPVGFASSIDYLILDHFVETLQCDFHTAFEILVSAGLTKDSAHDVIVSQYGNVFA